MSKISTTTGRAVPVHVVDTIEEIERLNSRCGHHFFDRDAKSFFGSKINPTVIAHRFFITTEKSGFDDPKRRATVRMVRDDGSVETVGEFLTFGTPAAARKALDVSRRPLDRETFGFGMLAQHGVSVRFDPYPSDLVAPENGEPGWLAKAAGTLTDRGLDKRFCWRAYVGDMPIGSRTTRHDAREIAREAASPCPL